MANARAPGPLCRVCAGRDCRSGASAGTRIVPYARRGQQRPAKETCARLGRSAHFIYAGSITQDEGPYRPGMVYDELLAGRVRDCLRRSPE
jgi:hypothetical protein